jgi:hypothetical protein
MRAWCVLAAWLAPVAALAEPSQEVQMQAAEFVERASATSLRGEHETAAQLYQRAYKLVGKPLLLSNIASEYQLMGKPQWALSYFCRYLVTDPRGANASYATQQVRALSVELGGSETDREDDICRPVLAADGAPAGTTSRVQPPPVAEEPSDTAGISPWRVAGLGVAGVGLAAFGVGVYYGLEARALDTELSNHPVDEPWPVDLRDREARGESYNRRAIALMAGGGAAIVIGAAMFVLLGSASTGPDSVTVAPVVAPGSFGIAAAGRF